MADYPYQVDVLFPGFSGKLTNGGLGWGTCALIRGNGLTILLDCGSPTITGTFNGMLAEHGVKPEDVDYVLITHMHFDHVYCVERFKNATFIVSEQEWNYSVSPDLTDPFTDRYSPLWLRNCGRLKLVSTDGEEVLPGIQMILTPGHTPGSASYVLHQSDSERWVFSGDAAKNRGELRTRTVQMTLDLESSTASLEKICKIATRVLPGHDGWLTIKDGEVIAEGGNDATFVFAQGVTVNGGADKVVLKMD